MLQFIIGVLVGGIFGFAIFAVCTVAGNDDRNETKDNKRIGEDDIGSK